MGAQGQQPPGLIAAMRPLKKPEEYQRIQQKKLEQAEAEHDTRAGVTSKMIADYAKLKQGMAEQAYGYKVDQQGKPIKPPVVKPVAAPVSATPYDNVFRNDWSGQPPVGATKPTGGTGTWPGGAVTPLPQFTSEPAATGPSQAELDAEKAKADAAAKAQSEADAIAEAKRQRDAQRKSRGFGLGAFLTGGWQGASGNALSAVLGVK